MMRQILRDPSDMKINEQRTQFGVHDPHYSSIVSAAVHCWFDELHGHLFSTYTNISAP